MQLITLCLIYENSGYIGRVVRHKSDSRLQKDVYNVPIVHI